MDKCVLLTSTPSWVVSPWGETTDSAVDVNNTHLSMINPLNNCCMYYDDRAVNITLGFIKILDTSVSYVFVSDSQAFWIVLQAQYSGIFCRNNE